MMDGVFPADKAQMNMVMNQLLSLSRLIDDLHLLSLADAGQLTLNKQRFSPAGLLQEKIAGYGHGLPPGISVTTRISLRENVVRTRCESDRSLPF